MSKVIKLRQYSLEDHVDTSKYTVEMLCKLVHSANDSYRKIVGEEPKGDWDNLDDDTKLSTIRGVVYILKDPSVTPEAVHAKWVEDKQCEGWSYGEQMDETAKTHPCLTDYFDLTLEHRMKDHIFSGIVKSVLACLKEEQLPDISTECNCDYVPGMWN